MSQNKDEERRFAACTHQRFPDNYLIFFFVSFLERVKLWLSLGGSKRLLNTACDVVWTVFSYLNFFLSRKVTTWTLPKRSIKLILSDEKCVRKYILSIK